MPISFRLAFLALVALACAASPASAQGWPTRPITVVVPFAAGSSTDTAARILAVGMSEVLGQQLVIENVGGAAGMTGSLRVARSSPDGYQMLFGSVDTLAIAPALQKQPPYDTIKDFVPAGLVVEQPVVLIVREDIPVKTMAEFAAYAKANQSKMQFGSAGVGSGSHFACAKLNAALGIDTVHVPYRSSGLAAQDLIGGRLDYLCAFGATARQPIESGKARAIALLTADRSALFPQLTTSKEQGVAGVDSYFWSAFLFPKDTPDAFAQKVAEASNQTLNRPATIEQLRRAGIEPVAAERRSPAYQRDFTVAEVKSWADQVKASGLPLADRLSTFWGSEAALSRGEEGGRFPPVDRLDLAENGRLLAGREVRARVVRPSTEEMVIAAARQALNMFARPESMAQLRDPASLVAAGARSLTKRVLFPVRFLYTAQTGAIGRNDAAVEHFLRQATGSVAKLARDAFLWRYTPFTPGDPAVFATAREGLLPLYRLFADDYQARLSVLEDRELARAFSAWRVALDAPAASLDAPVG